MLELPSGLPVRFVLPNAPERPITLNGGMVMRGWYDLTGLEVVKQEDRAGLNEASQIVEKLVERECERGIPRSRIIVGGFSQGGAVALHYGLRCEQALAGIVGLSTYLPLSETLSAEKSSAAIQTPIFLAHGIFDPVLVLALGEASRQVLQENACTVEWRTYQMPHTVVPEELKDLSAWLLAKNMACRSKTLDCVLFDQVFLAQFKLFERLMNLRHVRIDFQSSAEDVYCGTKLMLSEEDES